MNIFSRRIFASTCISVCLAGSAHADDGVERLIEQALGVGQKQMDIAYSSDFEDDRFIGPELIYTGIINDYAGIRTEFYQLDRNGDGTGITITGLEAQLLLGYHLRGDGVGVYLAPGYFSEQWNPEGNSIDERSFSGFTLGLGLAANWGPVRLDLNGQLRRASRYDSFFREYTDAKLETDVSTYSLTLSYRF